MIGYGNLSTSGFYKSVDVLIQLPIQTKTKLLETNKIYVNFDKSQWTLNFSCFIGLR